MTPQCLARVVRIRIDRHPVDHVRRKSIEEEDGEGQRDRQIVHEGTSESIEMDAERDGLPYQRRQKGPNQSARMDDGH